MGRGFPFGLVSVASANAAFPVTLRAPDISVVFFRKSLRSVVVFISVCIEQIKDKE